MCARTRQSRWRRSRPQLRGLVSMLTGAGIYGGGHIMIRGPEYRRRPFVEAMVNGKGWGPRRLTPQKDGFPTPSPANWRYARIAQGSRGISNQRRHQVCNCFARRRLRGGWPTRRAVKQRQFNQAAFETYSHGRSCFETSQNHAITETVTPGQSTYGKSLGSPTTS